MDSYKLISHRVNGFGDGQLQQFERQVEQTLEGERAELLGGVEVTQLPNGYQLTQAVAIKNRNTTGIRKDRRGG